MSLNRRHVLKAASVVGLTSIVGGTVSADGNTGNTGIPGGKGTPQGGENARSKEKENMRLLDQNTLGGQGNGGEGMAVKEQDGNYTLYIGHSSSEGPVGLSVLDITDPKNTELVTQIDLPEGPVRWNNLDIASDHLYIASEPDEPDQPDSGIFVFDISTPTDPQQVAFYELRGAGPHYVWTPGDGFAHLSTGTSDFKPATSGHDQFYMILDISDPANPTEVSRWWLPGQAAEDSEDPLEDDGVGVRLHNVNVYPDKRPDRAYMGYIDGGVVIVDISDKSNPQLVSQFDPSPPLPGFTHTAVPLFEQDLLAVTDESVTQDCSDTPKLLWFYDISDEEHPMPISTAGRPDNWEELCQRPGRSGAHNIHEYAPDEAALESRDLVYGAFFNRGVRVYDPSDRYDPEQVAFYIPSGTQGSETSNINDVYVDERGVISATDRFGGGVYTFKLLPQAMR